jgi:hypothetical protein
MLGKASETPQVADEGRMVDIAQLAPKEMRGLSAALDTPFRPTGGRL